MASRSSGKHSTGGRLRLARRHLEAMISHARATAPNEACGLLAGSGNVVQTVHCLANDRNSAVAFELTADGYLLAMALDDAGRLLGAFHSHPRSPAYPSPTDVREAYWPIITVIVSLAGAQPEARGFRIRRGDGNDEQPVVEDVVLEVI